MLLPGLGHATGRVAATERVPQGQAARRSAADKLSTCYWAGGSFATGRGLATGRVGSGLGRDPSQVVLLLGAPPPRVGGSAGVRGCLTTPNVGVLTTGARRWLPTGARR